MPTIRARATRTAFQRALELQRRQRERAHGTLHPDDPTERFDRAAIGLRRSLDRIARYSRPAQGVAVLSVRGGPVKCSWLVPDRPTDGRVLLYLHGGAYVAGSRWTHLGLASSLARTAGARVALPEYRLAPEHRFPAAVDDAVATYRWLLEDEGVDPARLVVAGDSAGGGLTFALALALRDQGLPLPAGLVGLSPWTDLTASGESIVTRNEVDPWLDGRFIGAVGRVYAGDDVAHPYASPLLGDLTGLPPLLVHVGRDEVLLDDARRLVTKARAAGVDASIGVFDGMWHVFQAMSFVPEARRSLREIGRFVRAVTAVAEVRAAS